jgi:uncharacterized membrane protein YeaQ/YmgE (transglycosylase-associated protein family)
VDWISTIIVALLAGLILGPLARLLVPGKQKIGIIITVLVGAGAALVAGIIATALGVAKRAGSTGSSTSSRLCWRWSV